VRAFLDEHHSDIASRFRQVIAQAEG